MDCISRVLAFLLTVFCVETIHAALLSTITTNASRVSNGVTIPTKPTTLKSCDNLTSLYNFASSECNLHSPRELVAFNYSNQTNSWHVLAVGVKTIVKAFIKEKEIVIPASPLHEFLISSSSRSLAINFTAPTKNTTIPFPNPFDIPLNNTNITIAIKEVRSGKTLNMQKATITLFGIPAAGICSATNCLDAVSNWLTAADAMKQCKNDSNYLRYRYNECFDAGEWGEYGPWRQCSKTCGKGTQKRTRVCTKNVCQGNNSETRPCSTAVCTLRILPDAGEWGQYGPWSQCSKTCGKGTQKRTRVCTKNVCQGSDSETRPCSTAVCPSRNLPGKEWCLHKTKMNINLEGVACCPFELTL